MTVYFKARPCRNTKAHEWIAWGSYTKLKADDPITEKGETVFAFGDTQEIAVARMKADFPNGSEFVDCTRPVFALAKDALFNPPRLG